MFNKFETKINSSLVVFAECNEVVMKPYVGYEGDWAEQKLVKKVKIMKCSGKFLPIFFDKSLFWQCCECGKKIGEPVYEKQT